MGEQMTATALFVSAPYIDGRIKGYCYLKLCQAAETAGIEVVNTNQPKEWKLGHQSMYRNILNGLDMVRTKNVFICEHDCIYGAEYFKPPTRQGEYSYSANIEYLTRGGMMERERRSGTMSTLYGNTEAIREAIHGKLNEIAENGRVRWAEPGDGLILRASARIIDIRHGSNFTGSRGGATYGHKRAKKIWQGIDQI
jgi:hypothetical protein